MPKASQKTPMISDLDKLRILTAEAGAPKSPGGAPAGISTTIPRVIWLRQSLEAGLRHPLLGPVLLLFLAFVLAFVVLHTVEHGVEGLLFTCAIMAAVVLRFVIVLGRISLVRRELRLPARRGPPRWASGLLPAPRPPTAAFALPLRL